MGPDEAELLRLAERPAAERNRLSLRDEPQGSRTSEPRSVIFIDDIALVDLVNDVERELANAERELYGAAGALHDDDVDLAGRYLRWTPLAVRLPSRELLGEPQDIASAAESESDP